MKRDSLYFNKKKPDGMDEYLSEYGWHFSKKAFEYAVKAMKQKDNSGKMKPVEPVTKEYVDELMRRFGITLENNVLYDAAYVANMCKADYWKKSIADEQHMAQYIKDTIDDDDAADGEVMVCWHAKMLRRGMAVDWEEMV